MISLDAFEGIAGCRWLALIRNEHQIKLSENAPSDSEKKVAIVAALMAHGLPMQGGDLIFEKAKVLIRQCDQGLLMLFCDLSLNPSMVDIVVADKDDGISTPSHASTNATSSGDTMSVIHGISLDDSLLPMDIVEELLDIYTEFLGPLARALARKDTAAAGLNLDRLTVGMWSKLLNTLATRISDVAKHEDFLDRAVMLKTRF